ncbi:MAG TPA: CDP-alcohol phosphatidyltransferase family protein [Candidatus Saccharimonadales bacterium]|nr:CDP-alcohol phosphatidyltransferase family protein [Candidatus Saccharimonadales bacterium]
MSSLKQEFKKDWAGLPNLVTEGRILGAPVSIALYLCSEGLWLAAMIVFSAVALTDKLDGYLAKRKDKNGHTHRTELGTRLDPIADKLLVGGTLVAQSIKHPWNWIPTVIILAREVDVTMMRRYAHARDQKIPVTGVARFKTVVQCIAIALLFLPVHGWDLFFVWAVVVAAIVLTMLTWFNYMGAFRRLFGKVAFKALYARRL